MEPALALVALVVVAVAFDLRRLIELEHLRHDRGTPQVIRSMPLSFKAPPAPYQSSTTAEGRNP